MRMRRRRRRRKRAFPTPPWQQCDATTRQIDRYKEVFFFLFIARGPHAETAFYGSPPRVPCLRTANSHRWYRCERATRTLSRVRCRAARHGKNRFQTTRLHTQQPAFHAALAFSALSSDSGCVEPPAVAQKPLLLPRGTTVFSLRHYLSHNYWYFHEPFSDFFIRLRIDFPDVSFLIRRRRR